MAIAHPAYEQLRQVTPTASVLLADNPGKMTLDGTNTWILRGTGSAECVVVDPGPRNKAHIDKIAELAGPVALTLITHRHFDHTAGLKRHIKRTGSPVRSADPKFLRDSDRPLEDGEVIEAAGLQIRVLATPGHTKDSVSFVLDDAVLTGDTILGRGTTVIDASDGTLADYLASMDRLVEAGAGKALLPAHGPDHADAAAVAKMYIAHRQQRLDQVRAALDTLGQDAKPMKVVRHVYADVDKKLWPAARQSVKAQLDYLRS
ncbi:MBL fold metallo-hydrolase [Antrihabitans cavernicola]|uniref:MBL fold metallo-hydrolase n=1 Tax=Antrihabitans cavernicola TaxID=2495913 RepID=A0A5A7SJV2_9NOCA|nr:MBL fold metallo-hydrolase [Spelaeibacter cavernicola]KAA0024471.1 MBL fold metallo-hydrolase [Spelaeibacter cavernicola]